MLSKKEIRHVRLAAEYIANNHNFFSTYSCVSLASVSNNDLSLVQQYIDFFGRADSFFSKWDGLSYGTEYSEDDRLTRSLLLLLFAETKGKL